MPVHVVTGGPSVGKSSVIRELSARGYYTCPEVARLLVDEGISRGKTADEVFADPEFQHEVFNRKLAVEARAIETAPPGEHIFTDRSLVDIIAYADYYDYDRPGELERVVEDRYDTVFVLDQLGFEGDYARREDADEAHEVHERIKQAYRECGYQTVPVEVMPVSDRVELIESMVTGPVPAIH